MLRFEYAVKRGAVGRSCYRFKLVIAGGTC